MEPAAGRERSLGATARPARTHHPLSSPRPSTIYNMCTQKPPHDYSAELYARYGDAFSSHITAKVGGGRGMVAWVGGSWRREGRGGGLRRLGGRGGGGGHSGRPSHNACTASATAAPTPPSHTPPHPTLPPPTSSNPPIPRPLGPARSARAPRRVPAAGAGVALGRAQSDDALAVPLLQLSGPV